jgi:hypothetical protein
MVDALETAGAAGLALRPQRADEPRMQPPPDPLIPKHRDFDGMIDSWLSLTYVLNNLSRGLGLPDSYPFVLSSPAIEKLRFIHQTIDEKGWETAPESARREAPAAAVAPVDAPAAAMTPVEAPAAATQPAAPPVP